MFLYNLGNPQWDNESNDYGLKRDSNERDELLIQLLHKNDWIIKGEYYVWCRQCFEEADIIYLPSVPRFKYRYRYLRRKIRLEKGKKESA